MRIGLMLPDGGASLDDVVQAVVDVENDGFDNAWFGQTFGGDVMTIAALAAQRTSRIDIGSAVIPTYARHPFAMAQQAMTVNAAAGGRFVLGIGPSHQPVIENMWGLSYDKPARHIREYLSVLNPLVNEGRVSFQGEVFRTNAGLQVPGAKPLRVLISALAPLMLKIAGEMAGGTITWMAGTKTVASHVVPSIRQAAKDAGRPEPRVVVGLPVVVTDDEAAARERAAKAFAIYGQLPNYRRVLDREGAAGPADVALAGNEASVEKQIRDLASAGATDLDAAIFPVGDDPKASITRTRALLKSLVGKV